jgi:hypothetical protein
MDVNKIKILSSDVDREIIIPLGHDWDLYDRADSIKQEQQKILKQVIGTPPNYELSRYSHVANPSGISRLTYQFNFSQSVDGPWDASYLSKFTENQVRFYSDAFAKSFFKLDFYDSMDPKTQKNYFTVILPTSNSATVQESQCKEYFFTFRESFNRPSILKYTNCCGEEITAEGRGAIFPVVPATVLRICVKIGTDVTYTRFFVNQAGNVVEQVLIVDLNQGTGDYSIDLIGDCVCNSDLPTVDSSTRPLVTPTFFLDYFGKQEGFYLHWYEDRTLLNIDTFYMSAKFFNAATGQYTKFINNLQNDYVNLYRIPNKDYYHIVNMNYSNKTYEIISTQTDSQTSFVPWFEYINPPID